MPHRLDARWIEEALVAPPLADGAPRPGASRWKVGHVVPPVFEAYARIPHADQEDDLDPDRWALLAPLLARHTSAPEHLWAGRWEGRGTPAPLGRSGSRRRWVPKVRRHAPPAPEGRVTINRWTYDVDPISFTGPLPRFPSDLYWPEDRAWFFGSEPNDAFVSYVGGGARPGRGDPGRAGPRGAPDPARRPASALRRAHPGR